MHNLYQMSTCEQIIYIHDYAINGIYSLLSIWSIDGAPVRFCLGLLSTVMSGPGFRGKAWPITDKEALRLEFSLVTVSFGKLSIIRARFIFSLKASTLIFSHSELLFSGFFSSNLSYLLLLLLTRSPCFFFRLSIMLCCGSSLNILLNASSSCSTSLLRMR